MKNVEVVPAKNLYHWTKNFKRIQERFFDDNYKLRRVKQIEDFIKLNNFTKVFHDEEVRLDLNYGTAQRVRDLNQCDLILVTHQGYSRYPLQGIIEQIHKWLSLCDNLYLCLNRHYIDIDNQTVDLILPNDFLPAITSWLQQSLPYKVVDMSVDYLDQGEHFTWVVPDRHYFICKN